MADDDVLIPLSAARAQNRLVFFRFIALLGILGMIAMGALGYSAYTSLHDKQSPCADSIAGPECVARFCASVRNAEYPLSQTCKVLLGQVNRGKLDPGPGAGGLGSFPNLHDSPTLGPGGATPSKPQRQGFGGGGGGGSGGSGPAPGPAPGGGGSGTSTPSPTPAPSKGAVDQVLDGAQDSVNNIVDGVQNILNPKP